MPACTIFWEAQARKRLQRTEERTRLRRFTKCAHAPTTAVVQQEQHSKPLYLILIFDQPPSGSLLVSPMTRGSLRLFPFVCDQGIYARVEVYSKQNP